MRKETDLGRFNTNRLSQHQIEWKYFKIDSITSSNGESLPLGFGGHNFNDDDIWLVRLSYPALAKLS